MSPAPPATTAGAHLISQPGITYQDAIETNAACGVVVYCGACVTCAGGDNCSRSMFVGAVLGALQGDGIGAEWRGKVQNMDGIAQLAAALVAKRA